MANTANGQGKRNYGADLLRILAMWMVVTLHVEGHGGVLAAAEGSASGWAYLPECLAFCAVDLFALLSGYVGYTGGWRPAGFFALWCRVAFYSVGITVLAGVLHPGTVGLTDVAHAVFPITFQSNDYWYFTAYTGLFFAIPLLNYILRGMAPRRLVGCCLVLLAGFCVLPTLMRRDLFTLRDGYTAGWLAVLYLLGGCCRRCNLFAALKNRTLVLLALGAAALTWAQAQLQPRLQNGWALYAAVTDRFFERDASWMNYTAPTVVVEAVALLVLFTRLRPAPWACKAIAWAAPLSFSAYLIQNHPQTLQYLIKGHFAGLAALPGPAIVLAVLATSAGIFLVCLGIDTVRAWLFKLLRVRQGCAKLEAWLRRGMHCAMAAVLAVSGGEDEN